jgi:hypothetical protein
MRLILGSDRPDTVKLSFFTDVEKTGTWTLRGEVEDDGITYGPVVKTPGLCGLRSDLDILLDDFRVSEVAPAQIAEAELLPYPTMLVEDEVSNSIPFTFRLIGRDEYGRVSLGVRGPVGGGFELLRSGDFLTWEKLIHERLGDSEFIFRDESAPPDKAFYQIRRLD